MAKRAADTIPLSGRASVYCCLSRPTKGEPTMMPPDKGNMMTTPPDEGEPTTITAGDDDGRGPNDCALDAPPLRFGQKNNNQLVTAAAKAGGGRKESADNHTATTTGDDITAQLMTDRGGGQ